VPSAFAANDVFQRSPNAYMILDRELRFVAANDAYLRITSSRLEDLLGKRLFDAFPHDPDDPENASSQLLRASFERVLATRKPDAVALVPYRVAREQDGLPEDRYWSATHTPLLDAHGEVAAILQHTVDVTELHSLRTERERRESVRDSVLSQQVEAGVLGRAQLVQEANALLDTERRHLRSLFEQAPGFAAFLRGPTHVFEIANTAYCELVGQRDIVGKSVREALPEIADQGFPELLDGVFRTGTPFVGRAMKALLRRQPGAELEEVYIDVIYQPIVDAGGRVTGIFVQGHDMSEQHRLEIERARLLEREKAAREEAERANRLKDDFLATVSHELRTPLTAMLGWVQMLRAGQITTEERRARALETIERNARAQSQLIEDLLDVSRIMSGSMRLNVETVAVASVVEAALESARPAADAKELAITTSLDSEAHILGDAGRVQQVVWNLLSNAVKFTPKGGAVAVSVARVEGAVEVVVADSGQGIAPEFIPYVFEPFRQAEGSSSRKHGGLGLGLAIVKHLVELHGGTLEVHSEGQGRGATFKVSLPLTSPRTDAGISGIATRPSPSDEATLERQPELVGLRLLVVDDEEDTRELLRAILERAGVTVETAASADEAVIAYERLRPDILLTDIAMPDEDGYALLRRIRALPDDVGRAPAVALTAYARTEDRTRALRAGFKAHVPKPVDARELVAVLLSLTPQAREMPARDSRTPAT
jgi:signal transduction histidine kinase/CheY-like chemotaxis protein